MLDILRGHSGAQRGYWLGSGIKWLQYRSVLFQEYPFFHFSLIKNSIIIILVKKCNHSKFIKMSKITYYDPDIFTLTRKQRA